MDGIRLQQRLKDAGYYSFTVDGAVGRRTYAALLGYMARKDLGDRGLKMGDGCVAQFPAAKLTDGLRVAHFITQIATETGGFSVFEENLSYSTAKRLTQVFPRYFKTEADAQPYLKNPQKLGNRVYANRLGNGAPESNDGWNFRGRGLIQLTGRDNYTARGKETGLPLADHPELASDPAGSVEIATLFWTARGINDPAGRDDLVAVRKLVNGGTNGLDEARTHLARAKKMLC